MVRWKCVLSRSLGPSPQKNVSVPQSQHILHYVYWQARAFSMLLFRGGSLSIWERSFPPFHPHTPVDRTLNAYQISCIGQ